MAFKWLRLSQTLDITSPTLKSHLRNARTYLSSSEFSIFRASSTLQTRYFSDTSLPPPADTPPLLPVKPFVKNFTKAPDASSSSVSDSEVAKFAAIAETWWDLEGPFKALHSMNPIRVSFIRSVLCRHFRKDPYCARPLEGLKIVDVGCGGGILSEPLARMGASVMGIDVVDKNIKIASLHAGLDPITSSINYCCITAEQLVEEQKKFDAVVALEIIEHVADAVEFCKSLSDLTVPNGATIISTINRSMRAFATAIVAAEYVLHWLPKGTHEWTRFLTPEEVVLILERHAISVQEMAGVAYNPFTGKWALSDDTSVNFIAFGAKKS